MKQITNTCMMIFIILVALVLPGCQDSGTGPDDWSYDFKPAGECKTHQWNGAGGDATCVQFNYSADGTLWMLHTDSMLNCCPGIITIEIRIEGNIITIREWESDPVCYCICPYDLEWSIYNLQPGVYTLRLGFFEETLDLRQPGMGLFCRNPVTDG